MPKDRDIIIISGKIDQQKLMRYALDRLSRVNKIILSAPVENTDSFDAIRRYLTLVYNCTSGDVKTGHFKRGGKHVPIVRCEIISNKLEFSEEFTPVD